MAVCLEERLAALLLGEGVLGREQALTLISNAFNIDSARGIRKNTLIPRVGYHSVYECGFCSFLLLLQATTSA